MILCEGSNAFMDDFLSIIPKVEIKKEKMKRFDCIKE